MNDIPFYMLISMGRLVGLSNIHKFGFNPKVDKVDGFSTIQNGDGNYTGQDATEAETVEVFSSEIADATGEEGARKVKLIGLNANYDPAIEVVDLDGVNPVDTKKVYTRLDRMIVESAGGFGSNIGYISARQKTTTANIFARISAGYNQTMIAAYTIPAGYKGYLIIWFTGLSSKPNATASVRLLVRPHNKVFQVKEEIPVQNDGSSNFHRYYNTPRGPFGGKTDIKIVANTSVDGAAFGAGFDLILMDHENE